LRGLDGNGFESERLERELVHKLAVDRTSVR
jgi:hypothetical protein